MRGWEIRKRAAADRYGALVVQHLPAEGTGERTAAAARRSNQCDMARAFDQAIDGVEHGGAKLVGDLQALDLDRRRSR